jgi:murein DD-endopeptidase MepM/ murein hydrolase activator NlpD
MTPPIGPERKSARQKRLKALREAALHRPVLARHLSDGFNGRWSRKQWVQASLFATIGMLVAAIVPGFHADPVVPAHSAHRSMALALPPLPAKPKQASRPGDSWQLVEVEKGQTLGEIFAQLGIPTATMYRILEQPGVEEQLTRLRPGAELAFDLPAGGELRAMRFDRDDIHRVKLVIEGEQVRKEVIERPTSTRTRVAAGEISSSLYAAARQAGLSPAAIVAMTDEIFQYDIDFTNAQKGDRFSVVYDEVWREGERIGTGDILAATFTTGGKTYSGFRFEHDGRVGYYDADGRPLKKAFIRMPIPYARITSSYSPSRRHPVTGKVRAHEGVDYGAGRGTPIHAAGEGRIKFAGWQRGYGRTIIVDHGKGYSTLYAHMSRFGKYDRGERVAQGAVIGYVGASGLATGPHLHYEFRINGQHRNPLTVTMPPPEPLKGEALVAFRAQTAPAMARIQQYEEAFYARTDTARRNDKPRADGKA